MTRDSRVRAATIVLLLVLPVLAAPAWSGDSAFQSTFGSNFFNVNPPCPVKQFPTFESILPVPAIADPVQQRFLPILCQIQVSRNEKGVRKAKGNFVSEVLVLDLNSGEGELFTVESGKFTTNKDGVAKVQYEVDMQIFTDGFETGDTSAWSYTRADFSNGKKASAVSITCNSNTSRTQRTTWTRPED